MIRASCLLCVFALAGNACTDGGPHAAAAPGQGSEDILAGSSLPSIGSAGQGTTTDAGRPRDDSGRVEANAFPDDLADVAGRLPPGVRPVEHFLPAFGADATRDVGTNTPPVASFETVPECSPGADVAYAFSSTSSDANGDLLACSWAFPGGVPPDSTACAIDGVSFPGAGPAQAELIVDDGRGGRDSVTRVLEPCP